MKLEELYNCYREKMFNYFMIKLGSANDDEDMLEEVFLRPAKYSVRWTFIRNIKALVVRLARNEANLSLKRRKKKQMDPLDNCQLAETISPAIGSPDQATTEIISGALARLPEEQQEVIGFRVLEGLIFKKIALVCSLSFNTSASRLFTQSQSERSYRLQPWHKSKR